MPNQATHGGQRICCTITDKSHIKVIKVLQRRMLKPCLAMLLNFGQKMGSFLTFWSTLETKHAFNGDCSLANVPIHYLLGLFYSREVFKKSEINFFLAFLTHLNQKKLYTCNDACFLHLLSQRFLSTASLAHII